LGDTVMISTGPLKISVSASEEIFFDAYGNFWTVIEHDGMLKRMRT